MARRISNLLLILSVISVPLVCVQGFFIDLESLGISTKSDDGDSSDSTLLISTPKETAASEYVEIDSKTDPTKSVRLTINELKELILGPAKRVSTLKLKPQPINVFKSIEELKALILGSVKEITSKPQPINIKISTEGHSRETPLVAVPPSEAPPTYPPPEPPINYYEYQKKNSDRYKSYSSSGREPEDDDSSYWNVRPATSEDYKSNEVSSPPSSKETDDSRLYSMAKAVFRSPTKLVNSYSKSFNRWSSKPKSRSKPPRRPLPDITYRRRRKNRPSLRRNRPRQRPRPQQRRRPQRPSSYHSQASSYYGGDEYPENEYYDDQHRQSNSRPSAYGDQWDRASHLRGDEFDSTMPYDDIPDDLMPPARANPTFY